MGACRVSFQFVEAQLGSMLGDWDWGLVSGSTGLEGF